MMEDRIPQPLKYPYVLAVEGKDDKNLFEHLIGHYDMSPVDILLYGGKNKFPGFLSGLIRDPNFVKVTSLGIVRDADSNPKSSFQSVCTALKKVGLTVPRNPFELVGLKPQIAIAILPDANSKGIIEDICLNSVKNDPAMECVVKYFNCLNIKDLSLPKDISKAKAQVFLGSRPEPCISIGVAAQKKYWPINDAFKILEDFLKLLFD